jgi:hypothetical protein
MTNQQSHSDKFESSKLDLEVRRLDLDNSFRSSQLQEEVEKRKAEDRRHRDELRLKLQELRAASGRGLRFTAAQATVAAAALAVISGVGGAFIQSSSTRVVEADNRSPLLIFRKPKLMVIYSWSGRSRRLLQNWQDTNSRQNSY